ncbi:hypothetical protein B5M44_04255 [Shinella sumterensis]|uniref:DUF6511 domain-containing protein n=1 Tax=Shinella sumterensis TaxID=1967501 RepID=UPI00106ED1B7|nr:DUF6511 domain-containing protein [Shinella sumterensis]MCD1264047.1 hypothetical protein [Shinella sumterensis]TFE99418.1 hypothetical protein B5M44_04255 [Shinella sumterensis]
MTRLPGKDILPITPTADEHGNPTVCRVCSMRSFGVGVGFTSRTDKDPGYLCLECSALIETVRDMRRFDVYELKALDGCLEELGAIIDERGISDLNHFDELDAKMLCKRIVMAFGDTLRRLLREEAPF